MDAVVKVSCTPDKSRVLGFVVDACWDEIRYKLKIDERNNAP